MKKTGQMTAIERAEAALAEEESRLGIGQPPPDGQQVADDQQQQSHQQHEPPQGHGDEPPAAPQTPPAQQRQQEDPDSSTYKARWEVSQGIIRSQSEQLRQAMEQNRHLLEKVDALLERQTAAPQPSPAPAMPFQNREELAAEVGADMAEVILSREALLEAKWSDRVARLEAALEKLAPITEDVREVKASQQQSESDAFKARLSQRVPTWQTIIPDPRFRQWAASTTEPISGKTYGQLFDQANNVRPWNLEGMVAILNTFLGVTGTPPPPPQPQQQQQQQQIDPRQAHVAPGARGGGSYNGQDPPAQQVTEQQFQEAGDLYVKGRLPEAEYLKIERAFFNQNRGAVR